jgi:hypothetical protein
MVAMVSPAPFASTPTSPSSSMYLRPVSAALASSAVLGSGVPSAASSGRRGIAASSSTSLQSSATSRPSGVSASGLISSSSASFRAKTS